MIQVLSLPGVWKYTPPRLEDERGWFSETFNAQALDIALKGIVFVQDNQSLSRAAGTLRGMHFQIPTKAQDKLVRVLAGRVLDVALDLRPDSGFYGKWLSTELSARNGVQLFIPKGFAHGYLTLEPDTEVFYKVSDYYSSEHALGLAWDDPAIGIDWTIPHERVIMADRDRVLPRLADLPAFF
jgi:dTDP-4-dehydrorhamnose 3,5-epimerase